MEMEKQRAEDEFIAPNTRDSSMNEHIPQDGVKNSQSAVLIAELSAETLTTAKEEDFEYVTGVKFGVVMVGVTLISFLMLLDMSIVTTATPRITSQFHSLEDVGWYGSAYMLTCAALQPMTGKLYARFNVKYTYLAFFALFELGSLLCGVSTSSKMFIIGRAVAGMGSSGMMNGSLTIISICIPLAKRAVYVGMLISTAQFGMLFGPLVGGLLTEYTTWRWCFYINLPIGGLAAAALCLIQIPEIRAVDPTQRNSLPSFFRDLDIGGFLLFAPTMIMFLLALEWGGSTYAWNSATIIGLFCGSAGSLALFMGWEYKAGDSAMIPLEMVRNQVVYCSCLYMFFFFANNLITSYYLAIYFQGVQGVTPTLSGVYMLPGIFGQMISGVISGHAVTRLGYYLPWAIISPVLAAIGSGLISTFTPGSKTATWVGYQIIGGIGRGCGMQMPILAVQSSLPPSQIAVSMALVGFSQTFGGTLWLSFAEPTFTSGLQNALVKYAPGVTAEEVTSAGASGIRSLIPTASVEGVIMAYNAAIQHVFWLAAGAGAAGFFFSLGLGWKSVKKPRVVAPEA